MLTYFESENEVNTLRSCNGNVNGQQPFCQKEKGFKTRTKRSAVPLQTRSSCRIRPPQADQVVGAFLCIFTTNYKRNIRRFELGNSTDILFRNRIQELPIVENSHKQMKRNKTSPGI